MRFGSLLYLWSLAVAMPVHAGIPYFWLDAPAGRDNSHDPKSPHFQPDVSSSPDPTPTPLPGLTLHLKDAAGNPLAGFNIMLGNNPASAVLSNSAGQVNFPTATFPADVHVVSPLAYSSTANCVNSFLGITFTPLDLYLGQEAASTVTASVEFFVTQTAGTNFAMTRFTTNGGSGGSGDSGPGSGCSAPTPGVAYPDYESAQPGQEFNFCLIEYDCSWQPLDALFVPQQAMPAGGITITGQTSAAGISTAPGSVSPSNLGSWSYYDVEGDAGQSSSDEWEVISEDDLTSTATPIPWCYPSGSGFFSLNAFADHPYSVSDDAYVNMGIQASTPITVWDPALIQPGHATQVPSHGSPAFIIDRDPGIIANFGIGNLYDQVNGFNWVIYIQCGACPATYTFNLPTLPVGTPYSFNVGDTIGAYMGFYVGQPSSLWASQGAQGFNFFDQVSSHVERSAPW